MLRVLLWRGSAAAVVLLVAFGCTEGSGGVDPSTADASFTYAAEGGEEEERWAHAEFEAIDTGQTVGTWQLRLFDGTPARFSLTLVRQTQGPPELPPPGVYEIGYRPRDPNVFTAVFQVAGGRGAEPARYVTLDGEVGGTLTITESSEESVTGTFELTVSRYLANDGSGPERISLTSGEFTARPR